MKPDQKLQQLLDVFLASQKKPSDEKLLEYLSPTALSAQLALDTPQHAEDWQQTFHWIAQYLKYAANTNHHGFVNRMWSSANLPSILGEIITTLSNTSACTYESAPVATLMERYMLDCMLNLLGFSNGEGQMTTGSSNSNLIAMLAARNQANNSIKKKGLAQTQQHFALVSEDAHYSMDKAANILGIGTEHLIKIPIDARGRMDCAALETALLQIKQKNGIAFFVGATLGTTVRGAYDPLPAILKLRDQFGFWLHADGAWGGAVVLDTDLRQKYITDIERVDSFTWDFHKMLGTNLMCNMLLFNNHPNALECTCGAGDGSYIFRETEDEHSWDAGKSSLQCGRRVDSLKWFLDWKFFTQEGFARRINHFMRLCEYAESVINQQPELEMTAARESFNVCFRFITPEHISADAFNQQLRTKLYHEGTSLVGVGYIDRRLSLRLLITNPDFQTQDVDHFLQTLINAGKKLLQQS